MTRRVRWTCVQVALFAAVCVLASRGWSLASMPSPRPSSSATSLDRGGLLKSFERAQATELKALAHRNEMELKELAESQKAQLKEWNRDEADKRHKFFNTHDQGVDRRHYIQDFKLRREAYVNMLADERAQKQKEQAARVAELKRAQADRLSAFQAALAKGQRPPKDLWPQAGQ